MKLPYLTPTAQRTWMQNIFKGYNHNYEIDESEWYDTENLTNKYYPVMSQRAQRGTISTLTAPYGLAAKDALAYIDGNTLYYNGLSVLNNLSTALQPKQIVSMGGYICIFPDGRYYNTQDGTSGYMANSISLSGTTSIPINYYPSTKDGEQYTIRYTQAAEPTNPTEGDYWLDISDTTQPKLKMYTASGWTTIATAHTKIARSGIGSGFEKYDGITISGSNKAEINGNKIIQSVSNDYIVIAGILSDYSPQTSGTIKAERKIPKIDYVTECDNRLWGCFYGINEEGKPVNEIFCCVQGDFKNWNRYMGISTDSYAASRGSDGQWTGAITYQGFPMFFKENCIEKVYPSPTGAHTIKTAICRGVQKGSAKSLQIVNEILFYKSGIDVCAYDGSQPESISEDLGEEIYTEAVAGRAQDKYYISMKDGNDEYTLFSYDTQNGIWQKIDDTQLVYTATMDEELYYIDSDNTLKTMEGAAGTEETNPIQWSATSGIIGFETPNKKYISRFNIRMSLSESSSMDVYIEYDSSGKYIHMGHIEGYNLRTFTLPIRPIRCDHMRLRLTGEGEFKLYSISKTYEEGSDV